jgi:hypothetical protein
MLTSIENREASGFTKLWHLGSRTRTQLERDYALALMWDDFVNLILATILSSSPPQDLAGWYQARFRRNNSDKRSFYALLRPHLSMIMINFNHSALDRLAFEQIGNHPEWVISSLLSLKQVRSLFKLPQEHCRLPCRLARPAPTVLLGPVDMFGVELAIHLDAPRDRSRLRNLCFAVSASPQ